MDQSKMFQIYDPAHLPWMLKHHASSMEILAEPLMAGNPGNQAIWWLAINTPGSCYRWEGCLGHPQAVSWYVLCGVAVWYTQDSFGNGSNVGILWVACNPRYLKNKVPLPVCSMVLINYISDNFSAFRLRNSASTISNDVFLQQI